MRKDNESVFVEYRNRKVDEYINEAIAGVGVSHYRELLAKLVDEVIADMAIHNSHQ